MGGRLSGCEALVSAARTARAARTATANRLEPDEAPQRGDRRKDSRRGKPHDVRRRAGAADVAAGRNRGAVFGRLVRDRSGPDAQLSQHGLSLGPLVGGALEESPAEPEHPWRQGEKGMPPPGWFEAAAPVPARSEAISDSGGRPRYAVKSSQEPPLHAIPKGGVVTTAETEARASLARSRWRS
jgi:hypothetical protein